MITFRAATVEDLATLATLRWEMQLERGDAIGSVEQFIRDYAVLTRDELAAGRHEAWLAEDGRIPVACVVLVPWVLPPKPAAVTAARRRGFVTSVYTRPAYRRQGIARRLMRKLVPGARAQGIHRLVLWSSEMGRELYLGMGFAPSHALEYNLDLG